MIYSKLLTLSRIMFWQGEGEGSALTGGAVDPDTAVIRINNTQVTANYKSALSM